jgi:hypothetical protein
MNEIMFIVEEAAEGGYIARALGESIFTEANTLEELHNELRDAVKCHFEEGAEIQVTHSSNNCIKIWTYQ